jgi:hypothetical protein
LAQGPPYYLTPTNKWLPTYYPPEPWQVISSPPKFDEDGNRLAPMPPLGQPVYWWLLPRETWPYRDEIPWENKQFGAWPASKVTMPEDLRYIWPGKRRPHPPWGYLKLKMDGETDPPYTKGSQIFAMDMHIHMRWISPDEIKVKTAITPMGPRYYFKSDGWNQYEFDFKQLKAARRARRRAEIMEMLAAEKARTKHEQPKDLF